MAKSPAVAAQDSPNNGDTAQQTEPQSLMEVWQQLDLDRGAGLVPDPVRVAGGDLEGVTTGLEIGVISQPAPSDFDPITVESFKLVAKAYFFGRDKTDGGV